MNYGLLICILYQMGGSNITGSDDFQLLDGSDFLLLDGTNFLLFD